MTTHLVKIDLPLEVRMLLALVSVVHGAEILKDRLDKGEEGAVQLVSKELGDMHEKALPVISQFVQEIGTTAPQFLELYDKIREDTIAQMRKQKEDSNT